MGNPKLKLVGGRSSLCYPPFGGEEEAKIKENFDPKMQTAETALLFLQLIMRLLQGEPQSGRAGVVVPNGTLFGDGACAKVKEKLLTEYNLHTIVRLPNGSFAPYTSIPTNLLFFNASGSTEDIWYYEIPLPTDRKSFTQTKPIGDADFADCVDWWNNRTENNRAWKYAFRPAYEKAKTEAQPHWDAAKEAEAIANQCAKRVKELEAQIQNLNISLLDFTPKSQQTKLKKEIAALKHEQQQTQAEERQQRDRQKQEQATGDSLYWYIYNLDQKNPNTQTDFEHLPPEQLVANIWQKEERILAILAEIKDVLKAPPSNGEEDA